MARVGDDCWIRSPQAPLSPSGDCPRAKAVANPTNSFLCCQDKDNEPGKGQPKSSSVPD